MEQRPPMIQSTDERREATPPARRPYEKPRLSTSKAYEKVLLTTCSYNFQAQFGCECV